MVSLCLKSPITIPKLTILHPSLRMTKSKVHTSNKVHTSKNRTTIDAPDLLHISKFASVWWDPQGPTKSLHSYNIIRVPFIRDSLVSITPDTPQSTCLRGKKILDVGCGGGILTEELAKLGANLTGIDPSQELIQVAVEHSTLNKNLTNKPTYINTTIEEYSTEHNSKFDVVIAYDVLDHINTAERELFVESCVKALKPGGNFFISTPNRTRASQLLLIFLLEALKVIPRGTHQYNKFTTQNELKYWLELNDCRVDEVKGCVYYFWSNTWKWINWQALLFAMRAVKLDKNAQTDTSESGK